MGNRLIFRDEYEYFCFLKNEYEYFSFFKTEYEQKYDYLFEYLFEYLKGQDQMYDLTAMQ